MKKVIGLLVVFLVVSLVFIGSGCKAASAAETTVAATTAAAETTVAATTAAAQQKEDYVMLVVVYGVPYWIPGKTGWSDAGKYFKVNTEYTGYDSVDPTKESSMVDDLIARGGVSGVCLSPADEKASIPAIKRLMDAGIPVVTYISDSPGSNRICYVGDDNYQRGVGTAEAIAKEINYKGQVGISYGGGNPSQEVRLKGWKDTFAKYPDIKLVQVVNDAFDFTTGVREISSMLQAYPGINAIGSCDATSGACAAQAVMEAGHKPGDIKIVGIDANKDVLQYVLDGWIFETHATKDYLSGWWALEVLYWYNHSDKDMPSMSKWKGNGLVPVPDWINTSTLIITKDTAKLFLQ